MAGNALTRAERHEIPMIDHEVNIPPQYWETFTAAIEDGMDLETAAFFAGIPHAWLAWLADQADKWPGGDAEMYLREALQCRAALKKRMLRLVTGSDQWRAGAWFLERQYPEEFAKRPENKRSRPREELLDTLSNKLAAVGAKPLPNAVYEVEAMEHDEDEAGE